METLGLVLRLGLSLAAVLGLVWLFSKGLIKTGAGRRGAAAGAVTLLARQSLSRSGSVAVVQVGDRALVLGVTEQHVTLLTETSVTDLTPTATSEPTVAPATTSSDASPAPTATSEPTVAPATTSSDASGGTTAVPAQRTAPGQPGSLLAGSALSPATWAQALDVLREKTTRR